MALDEHFVPKRESLRRLLATACAEYAEPEQVRQIRQYVWELSQLMQTDDDETERADGKRARATSDATGEDVVSLLCKFEDYLESIMVGAAVRKLGRS